MTLAVFLISFLLFIFNLFNLIKINFDGPNTSSDQGKHINAVKKYNFFSFNPTAMHDLSQAKSSMKDVNIYLLKFLYFIFQKKISNVKLYGLFVNLMFTFSSIAIYFYVAELFEKNVSFLIYLLYVTSAWTYLLIYNLAVHFTGIFFFFLSLYVLELTPEFLNNQIAFLFSGLFFIIFNFSSASSRKIIIAYFILFTIFIKNNYFYGADFSKDHFVNGLYQIITYWILIILFCNYTKSNFFQSFLLKNLLKKNIIGIDKNLKLKQIKLKLKKYLGYVILSIISFSLFFQLLLVLSKNDIILLFNFVFYFFGIFIALFFFLYPKFFQNIKFYFSYWNITRYANHFLLYKSFNKNYKVLTWYKNFLFKFNSTISTIIVASIFFYINNLETNNYIFLFIFILIPITGIIFTEYTKGIRATLSYYTIFPLFLLLIAYLNSNLSDRDLFNRYVIYTLVAIHVLYNIYVIIFDIIPSKLHNHKLRNYLLKNKIKKLYTLKIPQNVYFIDTYKFHYKDEIKFIYVDKNYNFKRGDLIFIPCLNYKSVLFQSVISAHESLKNLLSETLYNFYIEKKIDDLTIKKFQNPGTSKFWQTCSEVSSFRLFCLDDVSEEDFELYGYSRIIKI
jgi:hypothetical protein